MPDHPRGTSHDHSEAKASEPTPASNLETEKLKLEVRLLERQLSKRWLALEWLKSGTVLVALIGVAVTLWVGFGQVRQAEQTRISERFDKALTRLASEKPNERMTGVSSLRLVLSEPDSSLKTQALHFLVDAASVEIAPLVQSAILDSFADLKQGDVAGTDLNELLKIVLERNRGLATSIRDQWPARVTQDKKEKLAGFPRLNLKADQIPNEIPQSVVAKLTVNEYLTLLEAERGPFEKLKPNLETPLRGLSQLITTLLRLGATANDFSRIACQWCDFSKAGNLSGAKFDKANLEHANFSRVNLKAASFKEANLSDAVFFAANLSDANLRDNTLEVNWNALTLGLPVFECANLKGADLSGTPLLHYSQELSVLKPENAHAVFAPRMLLTQIDKTTNLEYFTIVVVTHVSDRFLKNDLIGSSFDWVQLAEVPSHDPLFFWDTTPCRYRRYNLTSDYDYREVLSGTICVQMVKANNSRISYLRDELREMLSGTLDQPVLDSIPYISAFNRVLGSPPKKQLWRRASEYTCNDMQPPSVDKLRIDSTQ